MLVQSILSNDKYMSLRNLDVYNFTLKDQGVNLCEKIFLSLIQSNFY